MQNKARDLIFLDTQRYISLDSLRVFYWGIIIIPIMMAVIGVVGITNIGVNLRTLFPLVSIAVWSLCYWIFVLTIQSKKTKKTFELRFLVNGISGLLISSLIWIFFASFNLIADQPIVKIPFMLLLLGLYLVFSALYIALVVLGVHKGIFRRIKEKSQTKTFLAISAFFAALLPSAGVLGMYTSKMLRRYASVDTQNIAITVAFVLAVFLPALAHINFVQYYYCKKYQILCDENGNTTSPKLERSIKEKTIKAPKKEKTIKAKKADTQNAPKKKLPLAAKVIIGIVSVPILFFAVVFIVFFIKGMIKGLS